MAAATTSIGSEVLQSLGSARDNRVGGLQKVCRLGPIVSLGRSLSIEPARANLTPAANRLIAVSRLMKQCLFSSGGNEPKIESSLLMLCRLAARLTSRSAGCRALKSCRCYVCRYMCIYPAERVCLARPRPRGANFYVTSVEIIIK